MFVYSSLHVHAPIVVSTTNQTIFRYNNDEEDALAALHFPLYEKELKTLTALMESHVAEGKPPNQLLNCQIDILKE